MFNGARIRISDAVPLRMLVLDRETVITPELDADSACDLVLRGEVVARCFLAVFDCLWAAASDYGGRAEESAESAASRLGPAHISLLRALATGAKDEAVARLLGCSDRTLRRLIAQTLDELGVRSRFAAGVRAAQLGLLD
jgi:DNA-binding NarL/FixJ family response regulator